MMSYRRTVRQDTADILGRITTVALVLFTVGFGYFFYDQVLADPYLTYTNLPFHLASLPVRGEAIALDVGRCNHSDRARNYITSRELMNMDTGVVIVLPSAAVTVQPGCGQITSKLTPIPLDTPPGRYRVQGSVELNNTLRSRFVNWYSDTFVLP